MNPQAVADVMAFFAEYDRQEAEGRYVEADLGAAPFWPADKRLPVVSVRSLLLTVQNQQREIEAHKAANADLARSRESEVVALRGALDAAEEEIERLRGQVEFRVRRSAPDTSKAISTKVASGTFQEEVLNLFRYTGPARRAHGWTDDELEQHTGRTHQSVSAARNTLMRKGYIADSGQRRKTRSGNDAIVWKVVQ